MFNGVISRLQYFNEYSCPGMYVDGGPDCSKHFNFLESTPKKPSLIKMLHMNRIIE